MRQEHRVWYAVIEDGYDAWDDGSFDYDEALNIANEEGAHTIAVIEWDVEIRAGGAESTISDKLCTREITL